MSLFYRNSKSVTSIEGIEIDEMSLWKTSDRDNHLLVLVDDDRYITCELSNQFISSL